MNYELFYLVGESKENEIDSIKQRVEEIVEKEGGKFESIETSEKRKLAYKIGSEFRGTYIARRFSIIKNDDTETEDDNNTNNPIEKINRELRLYSDILRFIVVKTDDLPELKSKEAKEAEEKEKSTPQKSTVQTKKEKTEKEEKSKPEELDKKIDDILNI